jgi:hypothetical protein
MNGAASFAKERVRKLDGVRCCSGRILPFALGRGVGGSTLINAMMWVPPTAESPRAFPLYFPLGSDPPLCSVPHSLALALGDAPLPFAHNIKLL